MKLIHDLPLGNRDGTQLKAYVTEGKDPFVIIQLIQTMYGEDLHLSLEPKQLWVLIECLQELGEHVDSNRKIRE